MAIYCPLILMISKAHPENFHGEAREDRYCIQDACQWYYKPNNSKEGKCAICAIATKIDSMIKEVMPS